MQISTITIKDLIPEATRAIERYTKRSNTASILQKYDTHLTTDDLVMETVEKVIKANPQYLTKTYVWLSAKSVCINRCQKKRIITIDVLPTQSGDESFEPSLEQELIGDSYDHISDLYNDLLTRLTPEELQLLEALLDGQMYVVIAETLGISLRTLERRVQELKMKTEDILSTP
jgi:RNA polymerase sigma factor (sigma-70 family)